MPRVLFYGHYDVVSADNKHGNWLYEPFEMTGADGKLFGRGVSDNKGPLLAALYAVSDCVKQKSLPLDVIFLVEGEEECGSRGFEKSIRENKNKIGTIDWILLANSYWLDDQVPCLTYGLRGVIHCSVTIESSQPDLHSGVDGARFLDEPLKDLVWLIARLSGTRGSVNLPGFYDYVLPLEDEEKILYDDIAHYLMTQNPVLGPADKLTNSLMQRWREPCLTVHGFQTSGTEKSTIIPHRAQANLSLRLVPQQEAATMATKLTKFLQSQFESRNSKNNLKLTINRQAEPWLGDPQNHVYRTLEEAVVEIWGSSATWPEKGLISTGQRSSHPETPATLSEEPMQVATSPTLASSSLGQTSFQPQAANVIRKPSKSTSHDFAPSQSQFPRRRTSELSKTGKVSVTMKAKPLFIREGGSIPAIRYLEKEFNAPAAHLPCGQASDNAHLDNERMRMLNLINARKIFCKVFQNLSSPALLQG